MQDGFVADIGDFGKYGLLRSLCNINGLSPGPSLRLGVVWYFVRGDNIGKLTQYSEYRHCDPELYDKLQEIMYDGERSIARVERSGMLGKDAVFYGVPLSHVRKGLDSRKEDRARWLDGAISRTELCDVVFLDPDNGLNPESVEKHHAQSPFYAYLDEIERFVMEGKTLIVYHHTGRRGSVGEQIGRILERLRTTTSRNTTPFALRWRARSSRAYFILPSPSHETVLLERANEMVVGKWSRTFESRIYGLA